jgi:hypothetical protein
MRIITARAQMNSAREHLSQREEAISKMRLENPAIRLHGGPRERYKVACKRFVVAQLEHIMLKREQNAMELVSAREELSFSRRQFFRTQEVIALENRRNQFNYEVSQRRFTDIHKRLRSLRMAPNREELPINQEPTTKEVISLENRRNQFNYEVSQRRFTDIHKRLRSLRVAPIKEEHQEPTTKEE